MDALLKSRVDADDKKANSLAKRVYRVASAMIESGDDGALGTVEDVRAEASLSLA